jgi:hypothetical protein
MCAFPTTWDQKVALLMALTDNRVGGDLTKTGRLYDSLVVWVMASLGTIRVTNYLS